MFGLDHTKGYVSSDIRISFAIAYFDSEESAQEASADENAKGNTYNGGMFHGMQCGRDKTWDHTDDKGRKLYAVTY
jgi:hypothetical protein|tara:strand:+ start:71 stop:298 length:228 start_codon:yes stop_codon:yes gene_type:complete